MAQWDKLHWKEEHCLPEGIILKPHTDKKGNKTVKATHDAHDWSALDWSPQEDMAHLHDGEVDHIHVLPVKRPQGISVHAVWRDKDNTVLRQDAHFQFPKR